MRAPTKSSNPSPDAPGFEALAIDKSSTIERIAAALSEAIISGQIEPGSPVQEARIGRVLTVSRTSIREALRMLAADGLVRHEMHRGFVVTKLTEGEVADIYAVRRLLEPAGVDAGVSATRSELEALVERAADFGSAAEAGDRLGLVKADRAFHHTIVDLLGSSRLGAFFDRVFVELQLTASTVDRRYGEIGTQTREHAAVADALMGGKTDSARELLLGHLRRAEERLTALAREQDDTGKGR